MPRSHPGIDRGECRQDEMLRNHLKPGPNTQKTCLCHNRAASLPRPAPTLNGAVGRAKQEETPQTPTPKRRKRQKQSDKKNPDPQNPEKRKTIERSGDAKISCSRLRLEIPLPDVGSRSFVFFNHGRYVSFRAIGLTWGI